MEELGFDSGFNYKEESPFEALKRLAPQGIDIYYDNVGGEHLSAALDALNRYGRIVVCGIISQYHAEEQHALRDIEQVLKKSVTMRGFIVTDPELGPKYAKEHQERVGSWAKDGTFRVLIDETEGIDNAPAGLVGIFHGRNKGKAVLKWT